MKKKITVVVADGRVQSVFADEELEVEIVDFDSDSSDEEEQNDLANYVDGLRETKKETIC
jgi:hypothetical protein